MIGTLDFVLPEASELQAANEKIPVASVVSEAAPDGRDDNHGTDGADAPQSCAALSVDALGDLSDTDAAIVEAREVFLLAALERSKLEGQLKRSKKREKDALEAYRDLVGRQQELPLCDPDPLERQTDFLGDNKTQSPPWRDFGGWRHAPLGELKLSSALHDKLVEHGIQTVGELEDLRGGRGLRSLKGVGQGKADRIEEAVIRWLSENRDREVFAAAAATHQNTPAAGDGNYSKWSGRVAATTPITAGIVEAAPFADLGAAVRIEAESDVRPDGALLGLSTSTPAGIAENDLRARHAAAIEARGRVAGGVPPGGNRRRRGRAAGTDMRGRSLVECRRGSL